MKTLLLMGLLLQFPALAQDPFGSTFDEKPRSNDVALVLLNESNGKVVEGFTNFAMKNMLRSHYPEENIFTFTKSELNGCMDLIRNQKNDFRCKNITSASCESDSLAWTSEVKEIEEKIKCPKINELKRALERGGSIDAYSATHGGEVGSLGKFVQGLSIRPDIQKKFRLFYSMGCEDASKGDESYAAKLALNSGFATFVGHKGFSISPVAFNSFKNKLGTGAPVKEAVEKFNKSIPGSVISSGTEMHIAGDPYTSTWSKPNMHAASKFCVVNRGKVSLGQLTSKGDCLTEDIITEYYLKYPKLIDEKFCDAQDPDDYSKHERALLGIGVCASVGHPMANANKQKIWNNYHGMFLRRMDANLTCSEGERDLARGLYCFANWAGKEPKEFKGALTMQSEFKNRYQTILKLMESFSPADCQSKN